VAESRASSPAEHGCSAPIRARAKRSIELLLSCLGAIADEVGGDRPVNQLGWAVPQTNRENENRAREP